MNSYKSMIKRNWEFRCERLQSTMLAWSSRFFDSIFQRMQIVNTFALSRIYYAASILPLTRNFIQIIEKIIGKFMWKGAGKVLRVSYNEIKLSTDRGGIGLKCVEIMAKCLRLSQVLDC